MLRGTMVYLCCLVSLIKCVYIHFKLCDFRQTETVILLFVMSPKHFKLDKHYTTFKI